MRVFSQINKRQQKEKKNKKQKQKGGSAFRLG